MTQLKLLAVVRDAAQFEVEQLLLAMASEIGKCQIEELVKG